MHHQLPDRQAAASEAGKIHIQHPYDQPWSSSGLCSLPTALLFLHERPTAYLKTPLSSSWSLQMTPHWSASFRMVTSLLTDRRLRSWRSGAVLTTLSSTRSKLWRWSRTSGEPPPPPLPPCSPPTHHHEQHCDCSGVIQVPGHHHLPGPGHSHWVHGEKGPAEAVHCTLDNNYGTVVSILHHLSKWLIEGRGFRYRGGTSGIRRDFRCRRDFRYKVGLPV